MEKLHLASIPFYRFTTSETLNQKVLSHLESINFDHETRPEYGYVYSDYFHNELFDFFDECINQVAKIYYKPELNFPIVDCWVNKYKRMNLLRKHKHPNSTISGVYYVTSHEDDGYTRYAVENPWTKHCNVDDILHIANNKDHDLYAKVPSIAGTLVLFPPNIIHYMDTLRKISDTRYTIAFNTYAQGVISNHSTSKLEINPVSLRDRNMGKQN